MYVLHEFHMIFKILNKLATTAIFFSVSLTLEYGNCEYGTEPVKN